MILLNAAATVQRTEVLIRNLSFRAGGQNPSTAVRTVHMLLDDGAGGTSNAATETVNVVRRNDAPVLSTTIHPALNPIPEDYVTAGGKLVSSLIGGGE